MKHLPLTTLIMIMSFIMIGCASSPKQATVEPPPFSTLVITEADLNNPGMAIDGPKSYLTNGLTACKEASYKNCGILLYRGYKLSIEHGWSFKPRSKILILGTALKALYKASAFRESREVAQFMTEELNGDDIYLVPDDVQHLIYLGTVNTTKTFENDVEPSLKFNQKRSE